MAKYEFLQIIADVYKISLEDLLSRPSRLDTILMGIDMHPQFPSKGNYQQFLSQQLPESGRLAYIENMLHGGAITLAGVDVILAHNPILPVEMEEIAADVKKTFSDAYGLATPDYTLQFDPACNPRKPFPERNPETTWETQEIFLPTAGDIHICEDIAHEFSHAYHMENSALFGRLKLTAQANEQNARALRGLALYLIEGFATFMEVHYGHLRDQRNDIKLYEKTAREKLFHLALWDSDERSNRYYYDGFAFFERIFHHNGMEDVLRVANTFTNDHQLIEYVTKECP